MPTYEYICSKCNQQFEFSQSIKDPSLTTCPKEACRKKPWGKGKVKRAIGLGAGLIFKGSGFYITDYRSDSYKEAAKKDSAASAPAKTETKTDTKTTPSASGGSESKPATPAKSESKKETKSS